MKLYRLNKEVLSFQNKAGEFLKGLTSNDLDQPKNAFLNIHGRIIATFEQMYFPSGTVKDPLGACARLEDCALPDQETCWVILEKPFVRLVQKHLARYLTLSPVRMTVLKKCVYWDCASDQMVLSDRVLPEEVSDDDFAWYRLTHGMPVQGVDYTDEFVLNVSETDYVSFSKGCFLGQEPVAKVRNRSRPSRKLVVKFEEDCSAEEKAAMTSVARDPETGRPAGFVFVWNTEKKEETS